MCVGSPEGIFSFCFFLLLLSNSFSFIFFSFLKSHRLDSTDSAGTGLGTCEEIEKVGRKIVARILNRNSAGPKLGTHAFPFVLCVCCRFRNNGKKTISPCRSRKRQTESERHRQIQIMEDAILFFFCWGRISNGFPFFFQSNSLSTVQTRDSLITESIKLRLSQAEAHFASERRFPFLLFFSNGRLNWKIYSNDYFTKIMIAAMIKIGMKDHTISSDGKTKSRVKKI